MAKFKRILIIGSPGAGKSTFAKELAKILDIPLYHLDKIYWLPNFTRPVEKDFIEKLDKVLSEDSWIIDGNYYKTLEKRLKRADTVYFLDYNRILCVKSVLKRIKQYQNKVRDDMADGCVDKYDREFLQWVWDFPEKYRPIIQEMLENNKHIKLITFKSREEATNYLQELENKKSNPN